MTGTRQLEPLSAQTWEQLTAPCRYCTFWETDPAGQLAGRARKQAWLDQTEEQWGRCGLVLRVDGTAVGYASYAPPAHLPRARSFPTSPASEDSVVLAGLWLAPDHRGAGLGRVLLTAVTADLVSRSVRALEAFAGTDALSVGGDMSCLIPPRWLRSTGFALVRPHPVTARYRLDLRSTARWREDVEAVVGRIRHGRRTPLAAWQEGGELGPVVADSSIG